MTTTISPKHIVLYADDDPDDLLLIEEAFSHYSKDIELLTVCNGEEALDYLKHLPDHCPTPCLIILDINMPLKNGKEALRELRTLKRFADTPVILFTTSSMPVDKAFAAQYKAGFLTKPIEFKKIEEMATTFIEHCTAEVRNKIGALIQ